MLSPNTLCDLHTHSAPRFDEPWKIHSGNVVRLLPCRPLNLLRERVKRKRANNL